MSNIFIDEQLDFILKKGCEPASGTICGLATGP